MTKKSRFLVGAAIAALLCTPVAMRAFAQGLKIMDGSGGGTTMRVDSAGNAWVAIGPSIGVWECHIASVSGQATTAAILLTLEAPVATTMDVSRICVGTSNATAASLQTVTVRRITTASSGGTALTVEGTGTTAITRLDPTFGGNYTGVARLGGTPGTAGATLDQWGWTNGELGAGAADTPGQPYSCKSYGPAVASAPLYVAAGPQTGISVNLSSSGAGGLAAGSLSIEFCVARGSTPGA